MRKYYISLSHERLKATCVRISAERHFTLFIDEFQEFFRVNKSVFSDMQRIWDMYSTKSHINLIVCGSIFSMMTKIFRDKKEPLYNRQTHLMTVKPFRPSVMKDINIDMDKLKAKADAFLRATGEFKSYSLSFKGLSMDDM